MKKHIESKLGKQLDQARKYGGYGRNMVWKTVTKAAFEEMEKAAAAKFQRIDAQFAAKVQSGKRAKIEAPASCDIHSKTVVWLFGIGWGIFGEPGRFIMDDFGVSHMLRKGWK